MKAAYPNVNWKDGKLLNRTSKKDLEEQAAKKLLANCFPKYRKALIISSNYDYFSAR
ncbi:MAG: hypothetical protein IJ891_07490 [Prevotella sp.]|nr:hypothetical protein [Prevotella sp.]